MNLAAPSSRNALCPCGSGRRYKACHGVIAEPRDADDLHAQVAAGEARLAAHDLSEARRIAEEVLRRSPEHPRALRIVAHAVYEAGDPVEALQLLLRAVRAMPDAALPPLAQYAIWTSVNYMFTQALSGADVRGAGELRASYHAWDRSRSVVATPTIAVVLLWSDASDATARALQSVVAQERLPDEVVLVATDPPAAAHAERRLQSAGIRTVIRPVDAALTAAARINRGVRAATSEYVSVLSAPHAYAPDRLRALANAVARDDLAWGFGNAEFVDAAGRPASSEPAALKARSMLEGIAEADSIGFAFVHQEFVALSMSNLWFRRDFFAAIGDLPERHFASGWDWCLRALWEAEPGYLPSPSYLHCVDDGEAKGAVVVSGDAADAGQAQVAMFREFYARATTPDAIPPNPFAPSVAQWGLHFLKTPFQVGHVLAFDADALERLAAMIVERRERTTELRPGMNLVGFVFGEFGLGESLRALASACEAADVPFVLKDVDMRLRSRQADRTLAAHVSDTLRHRASLYCVNPDMMKPVNEALRVTRDLGGRNIGYWYWELDAIPAVWNDSIERVDEIWVATDFVAEAMQRATNHPVVKITPPIEPRVARAYRRSDFGLPEGPFLFLFSFDFNSFLKRKNPEAAVRAFRAAFPATRTDVALVIKSTNGHVEPAKLRALEEEVGGDPRVLMVDRFLARDEVYGLQTVVDAYVSLHRAEGLGLGLAESMYFGKPVIGTAYSGNMEFMDRDNSCLVGYRLVDVAPGEYLYDDARFRWADPDVDEAAAAMRRLADDPAFRTRIARAGQDTIRTRFNRVRTGALIRARLGALGML